MEGELIQSGTQAIAAGKRGIAWLLEQQNLDGSWKGLASHPFDAYYRGAWTLGHFGENAAAERLLGFVKREMMTPEGDFVPRAGAWHNSVHYPYSNALLVIGAQQVGRYDISRPGLGFMLSQQDPVWGGFYMGLAKPGERTTMNSKSTAMCGLASLACGDIDSAREAGDWLIRLLELQPALGQSFYTTSKPDGSLRTDFAPEETRWHMVDMKTMDTQCWYALGLPFAFAVRLFEATAAESYMQLAKKLFDIQLACGKPWDGPSSGKGAWACSMLYRITGETRYKEIALHVLSNFASRQQPDGWFRGWAYVEPKPGEPKVTPLQFETTNEFTLWMGLIGESLLARDAD